MQCPCDPWLNPEPTCCRAASTDCAAGRVTREHEDFAFASNRNGRLGRRSGWLRGHLVWPPADGSRLSDDTARNAERRAAQPLRSADMEVRRAAGEPDDLELSLRPQ